jgi:hypothetical protein
MKTTQPQKGVVCTFMHPSGNICLLIPAAPCFHPGQLVSTRGVEETLCFREVCVALARHLTGDWGEVDADIVEANEQGLSNSGPLASKYQSDQGTEFSFLTTADRSVTFLSLTSECLNVCEELEGRRAD